MKKVNHVDYTEAAFVRFLKWKGVETSLETMKTFLGTASASEDDVTFLSGFQRPLNWHFYNNGGHIDNTLIPGRRTSEKRVQKLVHKLEKYLSKSAAEQGPDELEDMLEVTGRIMHHIQDHSTPSHVIPIYHGPGLTDSYEVYGEVYAHQLSVVDTPGPVGRLEVSITSEELESAVREGLDSPTGVDAMMNLYETSAQKSLHYIRENSCTLFCNGRKRTIPLKSFWVEHDDPESRCEKEERMKRFSAGFGSFGVLCNNFGTHCFMVGKDLYEAGEDAYLNIYKFFYKKAVLDSIVVLEYVCRNADLIHRKEYIAASPLWN